MRCLVVVHAVEAGPVPLEGRVLVAAPGKVEARPSRDVARRRDGLLAVVRGNLGRAYALRSVGAHAVVENHVGHGLHARRVNRVDGGQVLLPRAILGAHGALLVELSQVIGVVHAIANVVCAGHALVCGRQPHGGDAIVGKELGILGQAAPVPAVRVEVPREALEHRAVHKRSRRTYPMRVGCAQATTAATMATRMAGAKPMSPSTSEARKSHHTTRSPAPIAQPITRSTPTTRANTSHTAIAASMTGASRTARSDARRNVTMGTFPSGRQRGVHLLRESYPFSPKSLRQPQCPRPVQHRETHLKQYCQRVTTVL